MESWGRRDQPGGAQTSGEEHVSQGGACGNGGAGGVQGGFWVDSCWKRQHDTEACAVQSRSSLPFPKQDLGALPCTVRLGAPPRPENPLPCLWSRLGFLELSGIILGMHKRRQKDKEYK